MQRLDKYLWFVRLFKSRTLSAGAVSEGKVRINGERCAKPAHPVKPGDVLTVIVGDRVRVLKVVDGGTRRGPATEARTLYEDLTPAPTAADAAETASTPSRDRGAGRPTKRDRRALDALRRKDL